MIFGKIDRYQRRPKEIGVAEVSPPKIGVLQGGIGETNALHVGISENSIVDNSPDSFTGE